MVIEKAIGQLKNKYPENLFHLLFNIFKYSQPLEEFLLSQEVVFQRRDEQTLAEATRTAQEIIFASLHQLINQGDFVDVAIASPSYFFKTLYAYRINLAHGFSVINDCFCKNSERREQRQTKNKVFQFDYAEPHPILSKNNKRKEQRDAFVDVFCWQVADGGLFLEAVCTDRAD